MIESGFEVFLHETNESIGHITAKVNTVRYSIDLNWIFIAQTHRRMGYCTQALLTVLNVLKSRKKNNALAHDVNHVFIAIPTNNEAMLGVAKKFGLKESAAIKAPIHMSYFLQPLLSDIKVPVIKDQVTQNPIFSSRDELLSMQLY